MKVRPGQNLLRALYWEEEVNKHFVILIDGQQIAEERRAKSASSASIIRSRPR